MTTEKSVNFAYGNKRKLIKLKNNF